MAVIKTYHNVYNTHYHIVFPVKYRKALLQNSIPLAIVKIAGEIGERYDIDFEKIGTDNDHIHILCSFPPNTVVHLWYEYSVNHCSRII